MKNKEMRKIYKITRRLSYDKYHFSVVNDENGISWKLFRRYEDFDKYMDSKNKPILTSDENSLNDLKTFVKKHREYDLLDICRYLANIICVLIWVCVPLSHLISKDFIVVELTLLFIDFIILILGSYLSKKNSDSKFLTIKEDYIREIEKTQEVLKEWE